jgi:hypothetical protein
MYIELITPHKKQKEILDSLLDDSVFCTVSVIGRQFGKTLLAENIAIYWALNDPGCNIFFVSPTDGQNLRIYRDIVDAVIESGCIESRKMPRGGTEIIFKNRSKILFRSAASEDSLRGQPVEYMILDEAAFIKKDTIDAILLPMMAVKGKKMYVSSTPKSKNWLYEWYMKGKTDKNFRSFRFSTYDSPFANVEMIDEFRKTLPDKLFKQEIEAEFIDSSSVFNNINDVMIIERQLIPQDKNEYYGGIDIGIINDATVFTILDKDGNMVNYIKWDKTEAPELIKYIIDLDRIWKFKSIFIESNNQGLTIYQELKRHIKSITDFNTNMKSKPEIINNLIHAFNMRETRIIKDEYLRIELEAFIFKQKDGKIKFMSDNGFHDDCVMSLAIARECYLSHQKKKFKPQYASIYVPRPGRDEDDDW